MVTEAALFHKSLKHSPPLPTPHPLLVIVHPHVLLNRHARAVAEMIKRPAAHIIMEIAAWTGSDRCRALLVIDDMQRINTVASPPLPQPQPKSSTTNLKVGG